MNSRLRNCGWVALAITVGCTSARVVQPGGYGYILEAVDGNRPPVEIYRDSATGATDVVGDAKMELPSSGRCAYTIVVSHNLPGQTATSSSRTGFADCTSIALDNPTVAIDLGEPPGAHRYHFLKIFLADRAPGPD